MESGVSKSGLACHHSFEFSSDIDEPDMKCDKCGEPLEVVSSPEIRRLRSVAGAAVQWRQARSLEGAWQLNKASDALAQAVDRWQKGGV